ncbi:hypothetical protein [Burkholderia sp. MSMB0856]|uniref:hypothetical protein n=1 Tax=Burkholderia sp. MSMB0856 TaxID=1637869 RepID=UPI00131F084A|nr:hypothetical protein [Burkholderia sp. MSMB0856]
MTPFLRCTRIVGLSCVPRGCHEATVMPTRRHALCVRPLGPAITGIDGSLRRRCSKRECFHFSFVFVSPEIRFATFTFLAHTVLHGQMKCRRTSGPARAPAARRRSIEGRTSAARIRAQGFPFSGNATQRIATWTVNR